MKLQTRNPVLQFSPDASDLRESLSAAVIVGDSLWLASDESTSLERLSTEDGVTFGNHQSFSFNELITLPALNTDFDQEIDLEGMDVADSFLWFTGSHSIKRKKVDEPEPGQDAKLIKKLAKTEVDGNRFIIGRVPIVQTEGSLPIVAITDDVRGTHAAQLRGDTRSNQLMQALRAAEAGKGDPHLGSFLNIPGKDNGFDIEGMTVVDNRVFLGLRGPVLRGWAIILELQVGFADQTVMTLESLPGGSSLYRKHFLNLAGLGIRDLCRSGDDLLVLAGPTMVLDGPTRIYRWRDAVKLNAETIAGANQLTVAAEIPFGTGTDHAEGMTIVPETDDVMIVYDSPGEERRIGESSVRADIFTLL